MATQRERVLGRGFGRLWSDLRDSELSPTAKLLYAVMGSYGPEVRASVSTYAQAMRAKPATIRAAQQELIDAGWLVLVAEGSGNGPGKGRPRVWWLNDVPFQHLHDENTKAQIGDSAITSEQPAKITTSKPKEQTKHKDQDAFWSEAKRIWAERHGGQPLGWPRDARGFGRLLSSELDRLGLDELVRRWGNCVNDPWARTSLRSFILDTDRWVERRSAKNTSQSRQFQQPVTDWRPSGQVIGQKEETK